MHQWTGYCDPHQTRRLDDGDLMLDEKIGRNGQCRYGDERDAEACADTPSRIP